MHDDSVLNLLKRLIARRSVTPDADGAMEIIEGEIIPAGFNGERLASNGVDNLWATFGEGKPLLVFAGHIDVVPPGDGWTSDPFSPTTRDEFLYGRGAADMKSGVAAMTIAARRFAECHSPFGTIALLITSDEEGPAIHGTKYIVDILKSRGIKPDYCIVGEPTSAERLGDAIKIGRRGSLTGALTIHGKQGHIAYPHLADNPIHRLVNLLAAFASQSNEKPHPPFPPTSFQIAYVGGGVSDNVIPPSASARFNYRFSPPDSADLLIAKTESILNKSGAKWKCEWIPGALPFITDADSPLARATCEAIGENTPPPSLSADKINRSVGGGTSDGRFLRLICEQVIEFGPVGKTIHQPDECIRIADLESLAKIYGAILQKLMR